MKKAIQLSAFILILAYIFGAFVDANPFIWEWQQSTRTACGGVAAMVLISALLGYAIENSLNEK